MESKKTEWPPNFPRVMHFIDLDNMDAKPWHTLKAHPDYDAAKNHEYRAAAARLVHDFLKQPENQSQMLLLKTKFQDAIIVPVRAIESGGKNKIPLLLAEYIAHKTGLTLDTGIVQTNKVHRTGSGEWHRFAFRPAFDGPVQAGRRYILVDDVFAMGGSLNELRLFIEKNGGRVVQTAAMSLGGHGDSLSPSPEGTKMLLDKFGEKRLALFLKEINLYEGHWRCLTGPETFFLRRTASLDEARDRILAARCEGNSRMGEESLRKPQTLTRNKPSGGRHF